MSTTTSTILLVEEHDATRTFLAAELARRIPGDDRPGPAKALALLTRRTGPDPMTSTGRRWRCSTRSARETGSPAASTPTRP